MQWIITWNRPAFDSIIGFDSFESPFFSLFHKHKSTFTHISFSANKVWFLSRKNSSSNVCATFESNHKHTRTPPLRSYSEIHAELHAFRLTKFDFHMKYSSNPTYLAMDKLRYMWNAAHGTHWTWDQVMNLRLKIECVEFLWKQVKSSVIYIYVFAALWRSHCEHVWWFWTWF